MVFKLSGDQAELAKQGLALVGGSGSTKVRGEGLALALPAGRKEGQRAGVTYRKPLVGDFEITARFKALSLDRPAAEKSARFALSISTGSETEPDVVSLERACDPSGQQQIKAMCHHPPLKDAVELDDWFSASRLAAGEFRLLRRGTRIYYLTRDEGAQQFRVIESQVVSGQPVHAVELALYSDDLAADSKVVIEELTVRARHEP